LESRAIEGVARFVTNGVVRGLEDLEALYPPIFAMGVSPNSPGERGPGALGLPIVCGGAAIASGDVIIGDRDGVVAVPHARLFETLANLERVKAAEAAMLERVRGGLRELPVSGAARRRDNGS
jgi:4-hydroxy-4-methyl-2-oxoglutarate aldolase